MFFGHGVEHLARRGPRGHPFFVGREHGQVGVPTLGQFAGPDSLQFRGEAGVLLGVLGKPGVPFVADFAAPRADAFGEVLHHLIGHEELLVGGPAVGLLGGGHLVVAQRSAVGARAYPPCWEHRSQSRSAMINVGESVVFLKASIACSRAARSFASSTRRRSTRSRRTAWRRPR